MPTDDTTTVPADADKVTVTPTSTETPQPTTPETPTTPPENAWQIPENKENVDIEPQKDSQWDDKDDDLLSFWQDLLWDETEKKPDGEGNEPDTDPTKNPDPFHKEDPKIKELTETVETLSKTVDDNKKVLDVIEADPMLKSFIEAVVGGKEIKMHDAFKQYLAKQAWVFTSTPLQSQGNPPSTGQTLQQGIVEALKRQHPEQKMRLP